MLNLKKFFSTGLAVSIVVIGLAQSHGAHAQSACLKGTPSSSGNLYEPKRMMVVPIQAQTKPIFIYDETTHLNELKAKLEFTCKSLGGAISTESYQPVRIDTKTGFVGESMRAGLLANCIISS
jgi:hypothetical protein